MPFEAWALPWAFRIRENETTIWGEGDRPPLEYPRLSVDRLEQLLGTLRDARESLSRIPVSAVLTTVDQVARRLHDPGDELRRRALEGIEAHGGVSEPMAEEILTRMARDWTRPPLEALLHAEFQDPGVLDGLRPSRIGGEVRALGYPVSFNLGAGTVPGVSTTSLIRSLLVKSAVLLKPGRGDVPLSVLFARALQEAEPQVGGAVAVVYWPQTQEGLTETALKAADLAVVYGGDETVAWVRSRLPPTTHLVAYRHRLGVGVVGRDGLMGGGDADLARRTGGRRANAVETARSAALAVAVFDQRGCVSPHLIFVEEGGETGPEAWAEHLSGALKGMEEELPSGPVSAEEGSALQQLRGKAELEESQGRGRVFHGGSAAPWTVLFEPGGKPEVSCLNRTVKVIPVGAVADILPSLEPWRSHLQTVGVAGLGGGRQEVLEGLARLGVSRVVEMARVPWPPPWWHHDGSGPLQALVRWMDVEEG
ncbi:MAG: acyl-CoA reductase [Gemmatimonadota bacterium]